MNNLNRIENTKYIKKPISKDWLRKNNFRYSHTEHLNQEVSEDVYTYKFPVLKNETEVIMDCELSIYIQNTLPTSSADVVIDVYDHNTNNRYNPFYYYEYGDYEVLLGRINTKIEYELNRLGIKEKNKKRKK